jgi:hypothetical protein
MTKFGGTYFQLIFKILRVLAIMLLLGPGKGEISKKSHQQNFNFNVRSNKINSPVMKFA